jgi:hypothetical protein
MDQRLGLPEVKERAVHKADGTYAVNAAPRRFSPAQEGFKLGLTVFSGGPHPFQPGML